MSCHWLAAMPAEASGMSSSSALRITGSPPRLRAVALAGHLPWASPRRGGHFGDHLLPAAAVLTPEGPVQGAW
jgi:hypothetical protein